MNINLGSTVQDTVHGFRGVVTGRANYLTGCTQCYVESPILDKDHAPVGRWIDESRLTVDPVVPRVVFGADDLAELANPGGPVHAPPPSA